MSKKELVPVSVLPFTKWTRKVFHSDRSIIMTGASKVAIAAPAWFLLVWYCSLSIFWRAKLKVFLFHQVRWRKSYGTYEFDERHDDSNMAISHFIHTVKSEGGFLRLQHGNTACGNHLAFEERHAMWGGAEIVKCLAFHILLIFASLNMFLQ